MDPVESQGTFQTLNEASTRKTTVVGIQIKTKFTRTPNESAI